MHAHGVRVTIGVRLLLVDDHLVRVELSQPLRICFIGRRLRLGQLLAVCFDDVIHLVIADDRCTDPTVPSLEPKWLWDKLVART